MYYEDALDALQKPIKLGDVSIHADGDIRQTYLGYKAAVTISTQDKRLVQINPRG